MHIQAVKVGASGKVRMLAADIFWLASFVAIWALLIMFWNTWWTLAFVPMFTLMLAGIGEFLHQAAHCNLFGRVRWWNDTLGGFASAMVGIDLKTYRAFHLKHHRIVNTPDDPERAIYTFSTYVADVKGWKTLTNVEKIRMTAVAANRFGEAIVSTLNGDSLLVRILRWVIPLGIATIGLLEGFRLLLPAMVIVAWYLPLFLLSLIDMFLAQSRHYGTALIGTCDRVSIPEQYEISWNLKLPAVIEFMVMRRNLHAEHHEYPATHWSTAEDKHAGRTLYLGDYLRLWWAHGPRMMNAFE